jgi:NHL repeat-containing protein
LRSNFDGRCAYLATRDVRLSRHEVDAMRDGVHGLYIADTEFINKRILVFDMDTGAFKRGWGGKGVPLAEIPNERAAAYDTSGPPPDINEFNVLHCIHLSNDGRVYVCDRGNDRVQVFTKQGTFVTQFWIHPSTPAARYRMRWIDDAKAYRKPWKATVRFERIPSADLGEQPCAVRPAEDGKD